MRESRYMARRSSRSQGPEASVAYRAQLRSARITAALTSLAGAGLLHCARDTAALPQTPASKASSASSSSSSFRNPVLPGFHPDPSVVRVGEDYYLVTSSFEYFPGIPIFHSRDLMHWQQIGHVLTRESQLPLGNAQSSQGVFAPTLRHHDGTFYVVSTNVGGGGSFYVTARDPAGEWSEPVYLVEDGFTMDPSLFFDDDGKVYYTRHSGGERGGAGQAELDLVNGRLVRPPIQIWAGTGGVWPEGPHLYKRDGTYYLLLAEGGTSYQHAVTVARSTSPWGPFEAAPNNPVLSHRDRRSEPIQATGHADLVETADGRWWAVFLGIRPWNGTHHNLGRETFLAPVEWTADGWPLMRAPILLEMSSEGLPPAQPFPLRVARDQFDGPRLGLDWNFLRNPRAGEASLVERPGFLRLRGSAVTLNDVGSPAFVGRRQAHATVSASTLLEFAPTSEGQEAGLTLRANEANHYELALVQRGSARHVQLRTRVAGVSNVLRDEVVASGAIVLRVDAAPEEYSFSYRTENGPAQQLGSVPSVPLSSEAAGGFTGVYIGMYAIAPTPNAAPADFDWFEYTPR